MLQFYLDEHMYRAVQRGLMEHGVHSVLAVDLNMTGKDDDSEHLTLAAESNMVIVTFDRPFAGRTNGEDRSCRSCVPL